MRGMWVIERKARVWRAWEPQRGYQEGRMRLRIFRAITRNTKANYEWRLVRYTRVRQEKRKR